MKTSPEVKILELKFKVLVTKGTSKDRSEHRHCHGDDGEPNACRNSSSIWNERDLEKSLEGRRGTGAKHSKCCWINELGSGL